jgi:hypothetical protein
MAPETGQNKKTTSHTHTRMSLLHASVRLPWLHALCAVAEGAAAAAPTQGQHPYLLDARLAALNGRAGQPRSLGSVLGCFVALFLGSSFRGVTSVPLAVGVRAPSRRYNYEPAFTSAHVHAADGTTKLQMFAYLGRHTLMRVCVTRAHAVVDVHTTALAPTFWIRRLSIAPDGVEYMYGGHGEHLQVAAASPGGAGMKTWDAPPPMTHVLCAGADAVAVGKHFYSRDGRTQLAALPDVLFDVAYAPRADVFAVLTSDTYIAYDDPHGDNLWRSVVFYAPGDVTRVSHEVELLMGTWRSIAFCFDEQQFVVSDGFRCALICRTDGLCFRWLETLGGAVVASLGDATLLLARADTSLAVLS